MKKWNEPKVLELGIEKTEKHRPDGCYCPESGIPGSEHSHGSHKWDCDCCQGIMILPSFPDAIS